MKFEPRTKAIAFVLTCSTMLLPKQQVLAARPHAAVVIPIAVHNAYMEKPAGS